MDVNALTQPGVVALLQQLADEVERAGARKEREKAARWLRAQGRPPAERPHPGVNVGDPVDAPWRDFTDRLAEGVEHGEHLAVGAVSTGSCVEYPSLAETIALVQRLRDALAEELGPGGIMSESELAMLAGSEFIVKYGGPGEV